MNYRSTKAITDLDAYSIFKSMQLHFKGKYDAPRYNYKIRGVTEASLQKRPDKFVFARLSDAYKDRAKLIEYFASNFMFHKETITFAHDLSMDHLTRYNKYKQAQTYLFKKDIEYLHSVDETFNNHLIMVDNKLPNVIQYTLSEDIHLETAVILHDLTGYINNISSGTPLFAEHIRLIERSVPYVSINNREKLRNVILETFSQ